MNRLNFFKRLLGISVAAKISDKEPEQVAPLDRLTTVVRGKDIIIMSKRDRLNRRLS
jgi:hypothetical protein